MPLGLLGIGMIWLMVSGSDSANRALSEHTPDVDGSKIRDLAADGTQRTRSAAHHARDGIGQVATSGRDAVRNVSAGARRGAARIRDATRHGARRTADGLDYMRREQPLVTAALGLAFGALLATTALLRSEQEDEFMGDTRDDLMNQARATGDEKLDQAKSVAGSAAEAASDAAKAEAGHQGVGRSE